VAAGIQLTVYEGGDVHVTTGLVDKLRDGTVPTLNGTRYFLFEPPHHVVPPKLVETAKTLLDAGFVPILTHPERLTWIEKRYELVCELDEIGVPIQLTAGSITGDFGSRAKRWSDRMILEGRVDIIASDAHNTVSRPPGLSLAAQTLRELVGEAETHRITQANPAHILRNEALQLKQRVRAAVDDSENRKTANWSFSTVKDVVFGKKK
ncbi:MAG: CpsB/CapC family capsule biosynthesis tyrosine phosphatase, partial [Pseudomonadota bacterium]